MFKKILLVILLAVVIGLVYFYYKYNLSEYCNLENIKYHKLKLMYWYNNYKWQFIFIFFIAYSLSCLFIIPLFYLILNVIAGLIFGITVGFILASIVNFYTTIITFLVSRFLLRNFIEKKFNKTLITVNKQLKNNGIIYVFFIRSFPIMPFLVSNFVMGLTRMNIWVYALISQLSIIPELLLTLYVGKQLDKITNFNEIINTKNYIIMFILIAIFVIAYWLLNRYFTKKI